MAPVGGDDGDASLAARDSIRRIELEIERLEALYGQNGYPVSARRVGDWSDAEGLAIAPDGTAWVSAGPGPGARADAA